MLIHNFIEKAAKLYPNKPAIICNDLKITYQETFERIKKLAKFLQNKGLKKGDVISIIHFNCHYYYEVYYAASLCGLILNSINVRLSANEILYILENSETKLLIAHTRYEDELNKIKDKLPEIIWTDKDYEDIISSHDTNFQEVEYDAHHIAHLYYTSGTTGKPKGVMLTHKNVCFHSICAIGEFCIKDEDNWLHAAPMFHLADAWSTFAFTGAGASHTFLNDFEVEKVYELIEKEKITISNMVPTMLNLLVNSDKIENYDLSSLRVILSGGAPIAPELVKRIMEKFKCDYIQTYGMTETSPYLTVSILKEHLKKLPPEEQFKYKARTGREFLGVKLRVINSKGEDIEPNDKEVGEIIVKGDIVTPGYWKNPEETQKAIKNGWLHTGDMATIDKEGYVNIVDRKKDIIITGGENVYSTEVENVIYEHPAVLEVAVIGVPDEKWGEAVKAVIVLKEGMQATEQEIIDFVKSKIARYKAPKSVDFVEELPKTGSGKIQKTKIREWYLKINE